MEFPTARDLTRAFGPIYSVTGRESVRPQGSLGWTKAREPSEAEIGSVSLYFFVGPKDDWAQVTTGFGEHDKGEKSLVQHLMINTFNGVYRPRMRFPVTFTADREEFVIPVDGVPRRFTAYICGKAVIAISQGEDRWIQVETVKPRLRRLTLGTTSAGELREFLARARADHRRTIKWVEGQERGLTSGGVYVPRTS
jgi:hypothetical protein